MINKYQEFLNEQEFTHIIEEIYTLLESEGRRTGPNTYEWDFQDEDPEEKDFIDNVIEKLQAFLEKIPREKIKYYFDKFIESVASLPYAFKRKLLMAASIAFLAFTTLTSLLAPSADASTVSTPKVEATKIEFKKMLTKSSFEKAQDLVKFSEAGYSDDRNDTGNWIDVPGGRRFIGTKFGISAPVLQEYLGRLPKAEDMINLSYQTALKIYRSDYWDLQNLSNFVDQNVANVLYDGCVNQGVEGMKDVLRESLRDMGVKITDAESPFTKKKIRAANALDQEKLFDAIWKNRKSRYQQAATFAIHGTGWLNRLDSIKYEA